MHNHSNFSSLSLLTFMIIILVTANNFLLMFAGGVGVGICCYLLLNFWFTIIPANQSALPPLSNNNIIYSSIGGNTGVAIYFFTFTIGGYAITNFGLNLIDISWSFTAIEPICSELPKPTVEHIPYIPTVEHIPSIPTIQSIKEPIISTLPHYPRPLSYPFTIINPIHLKIIIGGCILGISGALCIIISLITNIFNSCLPKSLPLTGDKRKRAEYDKRYWDKVKNERNAKRRGTRQSKVFELILGGGGNGGGGDDGDGNRDGKGNKGQKEFDDKIFLIELLLNILAFFTILLLDIYEFPVQNSGFFNLDTTNWINGLNSVFDFINNNHPHYLEYYNYMIDTFNTFNGTAVQTDTGQTVYAIAIDNRDDIIERLNNVINIIREILDLIHPHFMDDLDWTEQ